MLSLTGRPLLLLAVAGAVLTLLAAVLLAVRRNDRPLGRRLLLRGAPVAVLVVLAQALAVSAFALEVNRQYAFYTSWADLTGGVTQGTAIQTNGLLTSGQGALHVVTVHNRRYGRDDQLMVWLPPQYSDPAFATHRFPVVMFLSGQPSSPQTVFRQFHFGSTATKAIAQGRTPPFVAVFPTLMVAPPRDTECTNVPNGPAAENWLAYDVPGYLAAHYRVRPVGKAWSAMGWSTGGFCAAKLVAAHPDRFGSAVNFGGYYQPIVDHTTGNLFGGRKELRWHNSPLWLYDHRSGLHGSRLLMIAGKQDHETWRSTSLMIRKTAGDPAVSHIAFPVGGHNYRNYSAYLPAALSWSASTW